MASTKSFTIHRLGHIPQCQPYIPRREDRELHATVKRFVFDNPEGMALAVAGESGSGKTTLIGHMLEHVHFISICGVTTVIYFNLATMVWDIPKSTRHSYLHAKITQLKPRGTTLLIFDHATCEESIEFAVNMARHSQFRCVIVHNPQESISCRLFQTIHINKLSTSDRVVLLQETLAQSCAKPPYELPEFLPENPVAVKLVAGILSRHDLRHVANCLKALHEASSSCLTAVKRLLEIMFVLESTNSEVSLFKQFGAFALFRPGEYVDIDELAIIWGFRSVTEAQWLCQKFQTLQLLGKAANDERRYTVHPLIHKATTELVPPGEELLLSIQGKRRNLLYFALQERRHRLARLVIQSVNVDSLVKLLRSKPSIVSPTALDLLLNDAKREEDLQITVLLFDRCCERTNQSAIPKKRQRILKKIYRFLLLRTNQFSNKALLAIAVTRNYIDMTRYLAEQVGKHVGPTDSDLEEALAVAVCEGNNQIAGLLIDRNVNPCAVVAMQAVVLENVEILEKMLKIPIDPNASEGLYNDTLLIGASRLGNHEIVEMLLCNAAHPNMRNRAGVTALMAACQAGHIRVVEVILNHEKTDINIQTKSGRDALMKSAENGHREIAKLLLSKGANVAAVGRLSPPFDELRCSALSLAVTRGHLEIAKLLLVNGALPQNDGNCSLTAAILSKNRELIELLLNYEADINAPAADGSTLLISACQSNIYGLDFVRTLLELNAQPHLKDRNGLTALVHCLQRFASSHRQSDLEKLKLIVQVSRPEVEIARSLFSGDPFLVDFAKQMRICSLEKLCIIQVRLLCGCGMLTEKINRLPLPPTIKRRLLLLS